MKFVTETEWELMKRETSEHLHDRAWKFRSHSEVHAAVLAPRPEVAFRYFSGNYPGKTAD